MQGMWFIYFGIWATLWCLGTIAGFVLVPHAWQFPAGSTFKEPTDLEWLHVNMHSEQPIADLTLQ